MECGTDMLTRSKSEYQELLEHINSLKKDGLRVNEYLLAQLEILKQIEKSSTEKMDT
jgi:hypothetical protein